MSSLPAPRALSEGVFSGQMPGVPPPIPRVETLHTDPSWLICLARTRARGLVRVASRVSRPRVALTPVRIARSHTARSHASAHPQAISISPLLTLRPPPCSILPSAVALPSWGVAPAVRCARCAQEVLNGTHEAGRAGDAHAGAGSGSTRDAHRAGDRTRTRGSEGSEGRNARRRCGRERGRFHLRVDAREGQELGRGAVPPRDHEREQDHHARHGLPVRGARGERHACGARRGYGRTQVRPLAR